jgi:DNA polymerase V
MNVLRKQHSAARVVTVFLQTNRFRRTPGNGLPAKQYYNSRTVRLTRASSTAELTRYALAALEEIFSSAMNIRKWA